MVKLTEKQIERLLNSYDKETVTLHFKNDDIKHECALDNVLTKNQIKKLDKRGSGTQGVRLKFSPAQISKYKSLASINKLKNNKKGGNMNGDNKKDMIKEMITDNPRLKELLRELYNQMIQPLIKDKTGKEKPYNKALEGLMMMYLSTRPEFVAKIDDINKLSDIDIFVKSLYDDVKIQGIKKGKGVMKDTWNIAKKILIKTAEIGYHLMTNTSSNILSMFKKKYINNPVNLLALIALLVDASAAGPAATFAVITNEVGSIIAPAFLEAVRTEISYQLPEGVARPLNLVVSALENVNTAKTTVNQIESALTGKVAQKVTEEIPELKGAQEGSLVLTGVAKNTLDSIPLFGGSKKYAINKELETKLNKITGGGNNKPWEEATIKKSTRKDKKLMAEWNGKIIHFGDAGAEHYMDETGIFTGLDHKDPKRLKSYIDRHSKIKKKDGSYAVDDPTSPAYWSLYILWNPRHMQ